MMQYNVTELRSLLEEYSRIDTRPEGVFSAFANKTKDALSFLDWLEQRGAGGSPEPDEPKEAEERHEYPPSPDYEACYRVKYTGWQSDMRMKREQYAFIPVSLFPNAPRINPTMSRAQKLLNKQLGHDETDVMAIDSVYFYTPSGHRLPDTWDPQKLTDKQQTARRAAENIAHLQELKGQQIRLLEEMAVTFRIQYWTGISHREIRCWGFAWEHMRNEFKKKYSRLHADNELARTHINFIVTKDDKTVPVPLMRRPEPRKRKG